MEKFKSFITEEEKPYRMVVLVHSTPDDPNKTGVKLAQTAQTTIQPQTLNYLGNNTVVESSGYVFSISDVRQFSSVLGAGIDTTQAATLNGTVTNGTDVSKTVIGTTLTLVATGVNTLYGNVGTATSVLYSLLTIVGRDSGARLQVPINITKTS